MQIQAATHVANQASALAAPAAAARRLTVADVSATALQRATGDGDGRTGAAALNDGDSAAQAARRGAVSLYA